MERNYDHIWAWGVKCGNCEKWIGDNEEIKEFYFGAYVLLHYPDIFHPKDLRGEESVYICKKCLNEWSKQIRSKNKEYWKKKTANRIINYSFLLIVVLMFYRIDILLKKLGGLGVFIPFVIALIGLLIAFVRLAKLPEKYDEVKLAHGVMNRHNNTTLVYKFSRKETKKVHPPSDLYWRKYMNPDCD